MENKDYLKDLSSIREMMQASSSFISLTGLSGVVSGFLVLIAGLYVYILTDYQVSNPTQLMQLHQNSILTVFAVLLVSCTLMTILLTRWKSKKNQEPIWSLSTRKLIFNFYSILGLGGVYLLILFGSQEYDLIVDLMCIFYGFAILNAAKYTFKEVDILGYIMVCTGICCAIFEQIDFWGFLFGFGVVHIIYGAIMHFKFNK